MIIARAPLRIPLGGGGTDLQFYSSKFGGFLLSVAIDKYVYVAVNRPPFDNMVRVKTREHEEVESFREVKHDARAALEYAGVQNNIEITFMGDVTGGTGLGTSSSYLVNLMNALTYIQGKSLGRQELAEAAAHAEIEMLNRRIGKQDHYMAAFGGIRILRIATDGLVKVEEPMISQDTLDELKTCLLLFYTGKKRQSGVILGEQERRAEENYDYYHKIKQIGLLILDALENGDLFRFGELMHDHWVAKRQLSGGVSNPEFDALYNHARKNGAVGGKLLGAGGGGFFLFFVERSKRRSLRHAMEEQGLREIPFSYDWEGAVLYPISHTRGQNFSQKFHSER